MMALFYLWLFGIFLMIKGQYRSIPELMSIYEDLGIEIDREELSVRDTGDVTGRGVFTNRALATDTRLFFVPNSAMLIESNGWGNPDMKLSNHAHDWLAGFKATDRMALFLLHQKANPDAKFHRYVNQLPADMSSFPIFWSDAELAELQACEVRQFAEARQQAVRTTYGQKIAPYAADSQSFLQNLDLGKEEEDDDEGEDDEDDLFVDADDESRSAHRPQGEAVPPPEGLEFVSALDFDKFRWALACVWSRSFALRINDTSVGGLVPFADMFNAASPPQPHQEVLSPVRIEIQTDGLSYYLSEPVLRNQELYAPYGKTSKSNAELLLDYGFVFVDNPQNRATVDPALLESRAAVDDDMESERRALFHQHKIDPTAKLPVAAVSVEPPSALITFARVQACNQQELENGACAWAFNGNEISQRNEIQAWTLAERLVFRQIARFPTSLKEDTATLNQLQQRSDLSSIARRRLGLALLMRMEEKEILWSVLRYIRAKRAAQKQESDLEWEL